MDKDLYRIERLDGEWTVRGENSWGTYYFGDDYKDCEEWVLNHNGEIVEVIKWQKGTLWICGLMMIFVGVQIVKDVPTMSALGTQII